MYFHQNEIKCNTEHVFTEIEIGSSLFLKLNLCQPDKLSLLNILGFKEISSKVQD